MNTKHNLKPLLCYQKRPDQKKTVLIRKALIKVNMEKYLKDDTQTFFEEKQPHAPVIRTKVSQSSELKDRLRTRLLKHKEKRLDKDRQKLPSNNTSDPNNRTSKIKVENRVPIPSNMLPPASLPRESISDVKEITDITGLVNYIEGNIATSKVEVAVKKAAKKARQKEKKEQERIEAELEAKRKLEEEKRKEKERLKELEELEKLKKQQEKQLKKKMKKQRQLAKKQEEVEETIPAMVTIKRVPNSDTGSPSVTITLKGYTPDQDKLLYTLVDKPDEKENTPIPKKENNLLVLESNKSKKKKKKEKEIVQPPEKPEIVTKEVKVTLAVDKNSGTVPAVLSNNITHSTKPHSCCNYKNSPAEEEIRTFGNLRLPPGITITKVENAAVNKKYLGSEAPVKSQQGVIVVDTEKLVKNNESDIKTHKKRKKKRNKNNELSNADSEEIVPKMVTLKNPLFQQYTQALNKSESIAEPVGAASIITNENGMVTIRSSRLQQSLDQGLPAKPLGFPIPMPVQEISTLPIAHSPIRITSPHKEENEYRSAVESEPLNDIINGISKTNINDFASPKSLSPEPVITKSTNYENTVQATLDAQQILSGLPGIEITKINKDSIKIEERIPEEAQVTIIPSSGNEFEFDFGKDDDWIYESVFKPRDVLEDELDDEELELEEFKRFCQQSVPPKCKEKVALNVADIVLKKKAADVKFS